MTVATVPAAAAVVLPDVKDVEELELCESTVVAELPAEESPLVAPEPLAEQAANEKITITIKHKVAIFFIHISMINSIFA